MIDADLLAQYPPSKIGPPPAQGLVGRPGLLRRLDGPEGLVVIVAPAGSGKTALLTSWAARSTGPTAIWYSLDAADGDPVRLVDGLAAAVERVMPGRGRSARQMLDRGADAFAALAALLAALTRTARPSRRSVPAVALVLDDCHALEGARGGEEVLAYVARHRGQGLRVILAGRTLPLVPALSASAMGDLLALGRDDLTFVGPDAEALVAAHAPRLPAERVAELVRVTGGWAMGLLLLARAQTGQIRFLPQPMEALSELLMTQIVDLLPGDLRRFLLETSLLDWFTASEADAILGRDDSRAQIEATLRAGLFVQVQPSAEAELAVRYHDLLASSLQRAQQREDSARSAAIHLRAAEQRRHDPARALAHGAALGDPVALVTLLEQLLPALRRRGMWETVIRYVELVPLALRSPLLLRFLSFACYSRGQDGDALAAADQAHAAALAAGDQSGAYSALVLRANPLLRQDRVREALELCLPALERVREEGNQQAEGWLTEICAEAYLQEGQLERGRALYEAVISRHRAAAQAGEPGARAALAGACHNLAARLANCGEDARAEESLTEAEALADELADVGLMALCRTTRSVLLLLRGQSDAAVLAAQDAARAAGARGLQAPWHTSLLVMALAWSQLGNLDAAIEALDKQAAVAAAPFAPLLVGTGLAARARIVLAAGDPRGAHEALGRALTLGLTGAALGAVRLEEGAVALFDGRLRDADRLLGEAEKILGARHLRPEQGRAIVLQADALWRLGREARALRCLEQAAGLALDRGWLGGLTRDVEPALIGLRALASHWRLHGKARQLVDHLVAAGGRPRVRLMPRPSAPSEVEEEDALDQEVLRFSPFGEGTLYRGREAQPVSRLRGEKARELLAFALWKIYPLGREEILDALWDGESTSRTRAALRMATYQLRRFLGADAWKLTGSEHTLVAAIDDDLRDLLALAVNMDDSHAAPTDLVELGTRALALYRAPYLPWCGSAWTEAPRQMATTAVLSIVQCLIAARRRLGHLTAALEVAEYGLRIEPAHDSLRHTQIHLLAELGRPGEAVESYRRYRQLLDEEGLGSPSAELRAFITSLRRR